MPLFELETSPKGRMRVFVRAQLPFLIGMVFVAVMVALSAPDLDHPPLLLAAYAVALASSAAAAAVPWERHNRAWMITIAVADIIAVALMRAELVSVLPSAGMLAIFPILWLAYGFPWYGIVVAVLGAGFITSFTFVVRDVWPTDFLAWANVITLPAIIIAVAVVVFVAAGHLRRGAARLATAHAEQATALREAEDAQLLTRSILQTVDAGIGFYDAENRLVVSNRHAEEMSALSGGRLDREPFAGDEVRGADRVTPLPYAEQVIPKALRGELGDQHLEWLGPVGRQIAIAASSRRVYRDDGVLLGTVIVALDVTELADAVEVREQFLRTVSHELRTPLTSIIGFLDLIEDALEDRDTKLRNYLQVVSRKMQDLMERISEMLSAASLDQPLTFHAADLVDIAASAVAKAEPLTVGREMTVRIHAPQRLQASADASRLQRAVYEVLTNALKFGETGSRVDVHVTDEAGRARITVVNRGYGITASELPRIFDRFYRTPFARAQAIQGFGLGLAVAKNIVAGHGGEIVVDSTPGETTSVAVEVPLAR